MIRFITVLVSYDYIFDQFISAVFAYELLTKQLTADDVVLIVDSQSAVLPHFDSTEDTTDRKAVVFGGLWLAASVRQHLKLSNDVFIRVEVFEGVGAFIKAINAFQLEQLRPFEDFSASDFNFDFKED